ncbi:MAG: D-cysteine desulfhydrase family protein [candidate division Zixibacteria bacterium]
MKINPPPRFSLSQLPTPLEILSLSPAPESKIEILIKRDDLTGSILSGNKIRKLEFLFYDLVSRKSDIVITCGGVQSNHCRAVAALCASAGLGCHLVLKGKRPKTPDGNFFFTDLFGAKSDFIAAREYENNVDSIMRKLAAKYAKKGKKPYVIPEGGSDPLGVWGYIKALEELKKQAGKANLKIDAIACAVGSGGTYAGLYLGSKLARWDVKIVGYAVSRDSLHYKKRIYDLCMAFANSEKVNIKIEPKEFWIDDRFVGPGYAKIGKTETEFIKNIARHSGIVLDPAYTSKALLGLFNCIADGEFRKRSNIVFIHTGGQWGLLPQRNKFKTTK